MDKERILEKYLRALLSGDRNASRSVIEETLQTGMTASSVYAEIIWPIMVEIEKLYRKDIINTAQESVATRINRTIVDQLQNKLPKSDNKSRRVCICSARDEHSELGAQIMADLFESDGWTTRMLGGTVNNDDILTYIHTFRPDVLLLHGIGPKQAPDVRRLIDTVKSVNAYPDMKIMLSGGVFHRADGLWEEIGADLYAPDARSAVKIASGDADIDAPKRTINRRKKKISEAIETIEVTV